MRDKEYIEKGIFYCLLIIAAVCLIFAISKKKNYHVDELLSYTLANNWTGWMFYEEGTKYESVNDYFNKQFGAQYGRRLKYDMVWKNQASDSHPPFFYALLHTVCSFFPEKVSKWQAGIINIIFGLLNMIIVDKLLCLLIYKCDKCLIHIIAFLYTILPGTLDNITFFRMYTIAMFWVTLVTYTVLMIKDKSENQDRIEHRYWMLFVFSSFMGVLSHYYCAIYIVFINIGLFAYFLLKKRYRFLAIQTLSSVIAAGISIIIFPAMFSQLFGGGGRGEEVQTNFTSNNSSDFYFQIKQFFIRLNNGLFGGILVYLLILLLSVLVFKFIYDRCKNNDKSRILSSDVAWTYGILLFSVISYFLLISKVTVLMETRYMFPIYSALYVTIISIIINIAFYIVNNKASYIVLAILVLFTLCSYGKARWEFLFLDDLLQDTMTNYSDVDAIVIDDGYTWKCVTAYEEVRLCKSVTFYSDTKFIEETELILDNDEYIVFCENDKVVEDCIGKVGKSYSYIGSFGYFNVYHIN